MSNELARLRAARRRRLEKKGLSSITWTESEPYALCFYLFNMFDAKPNKQIISTYESAIKLFMECTSSLNKTERLSKVLKKEIKNLESKKLLIPLTEPPTERMYFGDSDIIYSYEQDKKIDSEMRHYDTMDEDLINLHRVLFVSEKPLFSSIVNATIFKSGTDYKLDQELTFTKETEEAVFDISKTRFLMDQVQLSDDEARYLLMRCRLDTIELFDDLFRSSISRDNNFKDCMAAMIGLSNKELKYILRGNQKLKTYGFINSAGEYDDDLNDCIEEQSIDPYFSDLLKPLDCSDAYDLSSYSVTKESVEICSDLLNGKKPVSLLFYGKPGSGKTELAKSLCRQTDKNIYIFKNEAENNPQDGRTSLLGKLVCLLSMERKDSIIVVDEADSLLKTIQFSFFGMEPSSRKGTVNKMLENNRNKVLYIINHQQQIDESTKRRFTFSMKFEAMPQTMLRAIAESKINPLPISESTKTKILDLLDKYKLSGASAQIIANVIEGMNCPDEETILNKVQIVMKENSLLLNGKSKMRESACKEYDLSIVNATMNPQTIVDMVENAQKYSENHKESDTGIRMLFYGLSGTGKTEFARYIAETLHKPILLKRASDILSMWVGESEKNIRDAFEEAERTGSILLFDEADSFFQDRANARHSWEITQVNEFLTQMEEFSGILICTTNLRKIMDPAMQRRFHILSEFKALSEDGIKTLCARYFPELAFSEEQILSVAKYKTATPGDFSAIQGRFRFMNESEQTADCIAKELETLQKEKKKNINAELNIGFTA